jgi:outer membrane protein OmpA-like peptidoglycan-associated protein
MKKLLIFVAILLAFMVTTAKAESFGVTIPPDAAAYYYWNVMEGYWIAGPDVDIDEMTGWHTTCIGASFSDKGKPAPIVVPPPVVKIVPPPPPIVVVPPPPPPVVKPKPIFDPIYFDLNKTNITPLAANTLDKDGATLKANPDTKVEISGHTDNTGSESYNQTLSEKRARSAAKYIQDKFAIPDSQIKVKGYGSKRPIADNSKAEGRRLNRRVEIREVK